MTTIMDVDMSFRDLHHQDVRAAIKKRYGTILAFQKAHNLPATGVHDVLRGGTSKRVEDAIESVLMEQLNTQTVLSAHSKNSERLRSAA